MTAATTAHPSPSDHLPGRLRRFLRTVLPILAGLHAYIGWRLLPALPLDRVETALAAALLAALCLLVPLGMLARFLIVRQPLSDRIAWLGSLAMGFFSSLLVLTVLRDATLLIPLGPKWPSLSALGVPLLAVAVTLAGYVNARRVARIVEVDLPLPHLPPSLEGFSILQLSDIHVGPTIKQDYVAAIVDRVNALQPDLITITGDIVDGTVPHLRTHTAPLAGLRARHGVWMVTGNHEYYSGVDAWLAEFRRLGVKPLQNEHVVIEHGEGRFVLAGVTDFSAEVFDPAQASNPEQALAGSPPGLPRLLLAHQPRTAPQAAAAGFDAQLSGHTHGGQFWPWNHFVRLQQPFTAGLHQVGRMWIYTSRGTGYWGPPKRFGAPSEITRLRFVAANSQ